MKNNNEVENLVEAFKKSGTTQIEIESLKRYIDSTIEQVRKQERDKVRIFLSELNNYPPCTGG